MAIARLTGLSYWYPRARTAALDDVCLAIQEGVALVVGPSGGGKSTLLRVLNGLVPHFHGGRIAGQARVAGLDVLHTPTRRLARTVGFVFQDPELQAVYDTVEREVAFGLENLGFPRSQMLDLVERALHEVGAEQLRNRRIRTLSGGERQRVALASSLAPQPRLVVLDEPVSQLDRSGAELVLSSLTRIARAGRSVVVSEHRIDLLHAAAQAVIEVDHAQVRSLAAGEWQPPALSHRPAREGHPAGEAWSVADLVAGFAGRPVLEGVTLGGRQGEVVGLSGPNGSGKTTLLRVIAGALQPMSGRVERRPGRIAYLPQNPIALLQGPTVRSEVELTLKRAGERESPKVVLEALGLTNVRDRYPRDLSSGERQRAALAAVLAGRPRLALLDEPTRGMDIGAREALIALLSHLRDTGASIVLATHDAALLGGIADRVVTVAGGNAVEVERATA